MYLLGLAVQSESLATGLVRIGAVPWTRCPSGTAPVAQGVSERVHPDRALSCTDVAIVA